jgi:hypothetical protein
LRTRSDVANEAVQVLWREKHVSSSRAAQAHHSEREWNPSTRWDCTREGIARGLTEDQMSDDERQIGYAVEP